MSRRTSRPYLKHNYANLNVGKPSLEIVNNNIAFNHILEFILAQVTEFEEVDLKLNPKYTMQNSLKNSKQYNKKYINYVNESMKIIYNIYYVMNRYDNIYINEVYLYAPVLFESMYEKAKEHKNDTLLFISNYHINNEILEFANTCIKEFDMYIENVNYYLSKVASSRCY